MSYIICFWDKSKIQVNGQMGEKLQAAVMAEQIKTFKLGSNLYAVAGIEKIITKEDAYKVFPQEFSLLKTLEDEQVNLPALISGDNLGGDPQTPMFKPLDSTYTNGKIK